jgi:hypothetical protein
MQSGSNFPEEPAASRYAGKKAANDEGKKGHWLGLRANQHSCEQNGKIMEGKQDSMVEGEALQLEGDAQEIFPWAVSGPYIAFLCCASVQPGMHFSSKIHRKYKGNNWADYTGGTG